MDEREGSLSVGWLSFICRALLAVRAGRLHLHRKKKRTSNFGPLAYNGSVGTWLREAGRQAGWLADDPSIAVLSRQLRISDENKPGGIMCLFSSGGREGGREGGDRSPRGGREGCGCLSAGGVGERVR